MRNGLLLLLLLLAGPGAAGQPYSGRGVAWPVLRLACCRLVKPSGYGFYGRDSPQSDWYEQLRERATTRQLVRLSGHPSPVVRYYAFQALCQRPGAPVAEVLARHLTDNQRVDTFFGCLRSRDEVGSLFVYAALPDSAGSGPVTPPQWRRLDSLLLFKPGVRLFARSSRLAELPPRPGWHARLRQLAARATDGDGLLPALARYHDPADAPVLLRGLQQAENREALDAVFDFPAVELLYPPLAHEFTGRGLDADPQLCATLSRYPRPETVDLFRQPLQNPDTRERQQYAINLAVALRMHPHPLYAKLLQELPLSEADQEEVAQRLKELAAKP